MGSNKHLYYIKKEKFTDEELKSQEKFYYNMVSWKDKALNLGYKKGTGRY